MRKSLLMTSVLGLAMPTLAMANAAAAGSSSAVCGSGFFAQFDAKIMNAKLEIKNENKKTPDNTEKAAEVESKLIAAQEAALAKMDILFDGFTPQQTQKLRSAFAVGGLNVTRLLKATSRRQIEVIVLNALKGPANDLTSILNDAGGAPIAAPTPEQLDAVTDAQIDAALSAAGAVPAGVGVLTIPAGPTATIIAPDQFKKAVDQAVRLKTAIEADTVRAEAMKTLPGSDLISIASALAAGDQSNVFARKTILSTQAFDVAAGAISFSNLKNYNLEGFDNIFVVAGSTLGASGATTFANAKEAFLDKPGVSGGLRDLRAKALKDSNGWFADSVKARQASIAKDDAAIVKANENFDRRVHHHALAGGVGATVGWWQNLGGFALSISGSGDYLWGTFRTVDDAAGSTVKAEDKRRLGFGFQGDIGAHYIVSPSTTLGILVGLRGQQLNIGRTNVAQSTTTNSKDSKGDYASKWMINPVVTLQARTFFTDAVYGALSVGYVIPMEKDYKLENTNIKNKDAKIRFQGLTGAFSVGMMF